MKRRILSLGLSAVIMMTASTGLGLAARATETAGEGMTTQTTAAEEQPGMQIGDGTQPGIGAQADTQTGSEGVYTDAAGQVISAETAQALDNADLGAAQIGSGEDTDAASGAESDATSDVAGDPIADAAEGAMQNSTETGAEDMDKSTIGAAFDSAYQFVKEDVIVYVKEAVAVKAEPADEAEDVVLLAKYSSIHLTGSNASKYWEVRVGGEIGYLDSEVIVREQDEIEAMKVDDIRKEETEAQSRQEQEESIAEKASEAKEEWEVALKESRREDLANQTRSYGWNGPVLTRSNGSVYGPSGKETYYNLNMSGCVRNMNRRGYYYDVWVRNDGVKMFGDYIMCAANLGVHPFGSLVECSLGTCIVVDTGGFAAGNPHQLDIAVTW